MKVSQKLENACRVLVQLSKAHPGGQVTRVEELATREAVSANFLLQILNDLRRHGLVVSKRGKLGGYLLARPAGEITLRMIVEAVEGRPMEAEANVGGESGAAVARVWRKVARSFATTLEGVTLAEMAEDAAQGEMFYI